MTKPIATLSVYANPYAGGASSLDVDGRAAAFCAKFGRYDERVGATLDIEASTSLRGHVYKETGTAETIICTAYPEYTFYIGALRDGSLLPGDDDTARRIGAQYSDPKAIVDAAKEEAAMQWLAMYGTIPECAKAHE